MIVLISKQEFKQWLHAIKHTTVVDFYSMSNMRNLLIIYATGIIIQ